MDKDKDKDKYHFRKIKIDFFILCIITYCINHNIYTKNETVNTI
jgi:hypothetical protein